MPAGCTMAPEGASGAMSAHQAATTPAYALAVAADKVLIQRVVINSIQHVQDLGRGSFSRVDLVTVPVAANRKLCVRKTLHLAASTQKLGGADAPATLIVGLEPMPPPAPIIASSLQDFAREVAMHRACIGCPFLLQLLAAKQGRSSALLLLEYASRGSLHDALQALPEPDMTRTAPVVLQNLAPLSVHQGLAQSTCYHLLPGGMPEGRVRFYVACVLEALKWLHQRGIIHRDVKPENLLLFSDGYLKLADMGCCCELPKDGLQLPCTRTGTTSYMAPEVKSKQPYSFAVDVWSLGVTAWHLLAGELPAWADDTEHSGPLLFPAHFTQDAQHMLAAMLNQDAAIRPSIASIRSSSWFSGFNWEALQSQAMPAPLLLASLMPGTTTAAL